MPELTTVNICQGPNITCSIIYRGIRECEERKPFLKLPKNGRSRILTTSSNGFYTDDSNNAYDNLEYIEKDKFEDEILVTCDISPTGVL